jgi:hypothetical protein
VALTDGAEAWQKHRQAKLPGFTLVLDIIHVDEHLWQAGTALYGETDSPRATWGAPQMGDILSGRVAEVIHRLEETAGAHPKGGSVCQGLQRVAYYLRRNQDDMDYAESLRQGWLIGTGVVEGTCRHLVKDRMELSGMRWAVSGAGAL